MEEKKGRVKPWFIVQEINPDIDYFDYWRENVPPIPNVYGPSGARRSTRIACQPPEEARPGGQVAGVPAPPLRRRREDRVRLFSDILPDSEAHTQRSLVADYIVYTIRGLVHFPREGEDEPYVDSPYSVCFPTLSQLTAVLIPAGAERKRKSPTVTMFVIKNPKTFLENLGAETTMFTKHKNASSNHLLMVGPGCPIDISVRVKTETERFYRALVPSPIDSGLRVPIEVLRHPDSAGKLCIVDLDDRTIQVARLSETPFLKDGKRCEYVQVEWYDSWPACQTRTISQSLGHIIMISVCFYICLCLVATWFVTWKTQDTETDKIKWRLRRTARGRKGEAFTKGWPGAVHPASVRAIWPYQASRRGGVKIPAEVQDAIARWSAAEEARDNGSIGERTITTHAWKFRFPLILKEPIDHADNRDF